MLREDMMAAQGMSPDRIKVVTSDRTLQHAIGNALSQNVIERLLCKLLPAAGLVKEEKLIDRYAPS